MNVARLISHIQVADLAQQLQLGKTHVSDLQEALVVALPTHVTQAVAELQLLDPLIIVW